MDPEHDPQSLFELASKANDQFPAWSAALRNTTLGNALLVDAFQVGNVVEWAIQDALRNCVDTIGWRARNAHGPG